MEKLKIGIFNDSFYPMLDGVITCIDNLGTLLLKDCDVTIFTVGSCKGKKDTLSHPYKVVKSKSLRIFFLDYNLPLPAFDKQFKKALNESDLDLVYIHSPITIAKAGLKYAKKHNIPVVCHLHSQFWKDFYQSTKSKFLSNLLLKSIMKVFNKCDYAVAVNEFTRDLFKNEYKLKIPTEVIYNATNMLPLEDKDKAKELINEKYQLSADEKIFTFVGRLNKLKNIDLILDSLKLLKEKYSNFKFLLVGGGKAENHFRKRVTKLNLEDKVIFTGKVYDKELLKSIYARADLLLFPSHYDTDGIIKFEAASQGTPTVYIKGTGAASSIVDLETGFVAENNAQSFADKIYMAITDDKLYQKVSENCKTKLYRTWEDSAADVLHLLTKITKESKEKEGITPPRYKFLYSLASLSPAC